MAYVEIVEGKNKGTVIRLTGETVIGRALEKGISLHESNVSRQHASIREKDNYFILVDLGSANGTFVNGKQLSRFIPQPLYDGDAITICSCQLIFHAEGQDPLLLKKQAAEARNLTRGLSMMLTSDTRLPSVSATIDASRSMLEIAMGEKNGGSKALLDAVKRLQTMVKVSNDLSALTKPTGLFEKIMEGIFDIFPHANRAFILLSDKASGEMVPRLGRSRSPAGVTGDFAISRTIIKTVIEKKQSILSSDAQKDDRFAVQESIVKFSIRSLMCAPFICRDELLGIISVDTMSSLHAFNSEDLAMLTSIAGQVAIAIKNADLFTAVEKESQLRSTLSRYLSKDVVEGVIDGTIPLELGGGKKYGTVFFCDIVGFSVMAEKMSALAVVEKLNRYFSITTEIVTRNSGTLHKFGGDMIMAFWNVMLPDDNAQLHAIRASVEMQCALWKFNGELILEGQAPIFIGIGCNTGEFAGGNVGGEERMEYTVIGDNVNLAQRVESLASRWQVFAAESTWRPAAKVCSAIKLPAAHVRGTSREIQIYSIRGVVGEAGNMLLNIPVTIVNGGSAGVKAMLVEFAGADSTVRLEIPRGVELPANGQVILEYDLPELSQQIRLTARQKPVDTMDTAQKTSTVSSSIILSELTGEDALSFFNPGSCTVSGKTWDAMQRH
ncbi:MAG: adenylate/guanylate cyclase domain-containing protein [Chitinispirillaceae bacterium]|jgi:class 3 adenylate cyclase